MRNVVPLDKVGEHLIANFPGTQFQTQQASMNLLRKSEPLDHLWTSSLLENTVYSPKKK
jgi:hypothetical protein